MRFTLGCVVGSVAMLAIGARQPATALTALDVQWVKESREREELNSACVPSFFAGRQQAGQCGTTAPTKTKAEVVADRDAGR